MNPFPSERIAALNQAPINPGADFVLYWMIAFRRARWNFSLQRAVDWACELGKPLLVLEALSCDYPWASERLHTFILEGMKNNRSDFKGLPVCYFPFVEESRGQGKGLVRELAARSCLVVTDDYPCFFLPQMIRSVGKDLPARMEAIDSNGLLPMSLADRVFQTAYSFRRYLPSGNSRLFCTGLPAKIHSAASLFQGLKKSRSERNGRRQTPSWTVCRAYPEACRSIAP